jgi:U3 small nucleolar RNA-associated protein 10
MCLRFFLAAFWTREKAEKLIPHMAAQLAVLPSLTGAPESKGNHLATVTSSLAAVAEAMASSESVLKALNTSILLETRSEDAATRVASITALGAVWQRKGEEMIPLVPETVAQFLSELIEDENADVEKAARNVLTTIEGLVGDLQGYLT